MIELYNNFIQQLVLLQYQLNSYISNLIRSTNDDFTINNVFLILAISFLYGLIHAAGPGHGKALVAFYFTSSKELNYKKAFKIGYMISITHAISALILTFTIFYILKIMFRKNFNDFSLITIQISAIMIIIIGCYLIYEAYKNKYSKEHKISKSSKSEYYLSLTAGIVPCPGVMTIVLFCLILKQYTLAILAAITMSIGMGLTISIAGVLSILLNKKTTVVFNSKAYILELLGASMILLLGIFLLLSTH